MWEALPCSSSLGLGHQGQGRAGRQPEWETYSLGRSATTYVLLKLIPIRIRIEIPITMPIPIQKLMLTLIVIPIKIPINLLAIPTLPLPIRDCSLNI